MKQNVPLDKAHRLINPGCVVLLTSAKEGRPNVMALAWQMPVSGVPPLVAVAVARKHLTAEYILSSRDFALNVPGLAILPQVQYCGSVSGRKEDKFKSSGLTAEPASMVSSPLVGECLGHIECRLKVSHEAGDHYVFIGEVVAARADKAVFDEMWILTHGDRNSYPLHHLGGTSYTVPGLLARVEKDKGSGALTVAEVELGEQI